MKKTKLLFLCFILCIFLAYITNINAIPEELILFEGEKLNLSTIIGLSINKQEEIPIATRLSNNQVEYSKTENYQVSFLNTIPLKTIEASIKQGLMDSLKDGETKATCKQYKLSGTTTMKFNEKLFAEKHPNTYDKFLEPSLTYRLSKIKMEEE